MAGAGCQTDLSDGATGITSAYPTASLGAVGGAVGAPRTDVIGAHSPKKAVSHLLGEPTQLSVLTFNMEHKDRPDWLAVMGERLQSDLTEVPDFILCQEVVFNRSQRAGENSTANVLADVLGYHARGTKRSSDREGSAILSRYPFVHYEAREFKSQTSRFLLGFNRVGVMGEFKVPQVGRVRVVNLHLTNWGFESRVRGKQLTETLEWMAARNDRVPADLIILGGDFNIKPGDDELELITKGKLAKQFKFQDFNDHDAATRGSAGNPSSRVDYIFIASAKRSVKIADGGEQRLWIDGLQKPGSSTKFWLSDHVPVLHSYEIQPRAAIASAPGRASESIQ